MSSQKAIHSLVTLFAFGFCLLFPQPGRVQAAPGVFPGGRVYVNAAAGGLHNGTSWANAFTNLQPAIDAASSGEQVWVAAGTYKPGVVRTAAFVMKEGVKIYGGFDPLDASLSERNWAANRTILSGDIGNLGDKSDNSYHVIKNDGNNLTSAAVLDGFTILGGNAIGLGILGGGGMYNNNSYPTLANLRFLGNSADSGGALFNASSGLVTCSRVINVLFVGNTATNDGGGVVNLTCNSTFIQTTFSGNTASLGNGIADWIGSSSKVYNSILWGEEIASGLPSHPDVQYSISLNGDASQGNLYANPHFVRAPSPGGDSVWGTSDDDYGDLRLEANSPAMDMGSNGLLPADISDMDGDGNTSEPVPYDVDGKTRLVGLAVDMGASEDPLVPTHFYVNDDAPSPAHNGRSWETAFTDFQAGINAAASSNEVWVAAGVYTPTRGTDRTISFEMKEGVKIYGGFDATETSLSQRNWRENPAILSGDIGAPGIQTDNSFHVIKNDQNGLTSAAVLDGFTVTGGNASGAGSDAIGAGMYNRTASPTLRDLIFRANTAGANGGGMYNQASSPSLANASFSGNNAGSAGGGIYNQASSLSLTNASFSGNTAAQGGGIYNESSSPSIGNCILWGDTGGEIANLNSAPGVQYSLVQGGYAGTGNLDADPRFIDANGADDIFGTADDDLRLVAASPAIGAGANGLVPQDTADQNGDGDQNETMPFDLAGSYRVFGAQVDMGAFEKNPLYVNLAAAGAGNGTTWANAYPQLQPAIDAAIAGDQVWAAQGVYTPTSGADRTASFVMKEGVQIYGGFAGTETILDQRRWKEHVTILSGDIGTAGTSSDNSYHVVKNDQNGLTAAARLDGFTVTGGNASGAFTDSAGGGVYDKNSSPALCNLTVSGNTASSQGGGIYNENSSPALINANFLGNAADQGAGIYNNGGSPTLTNASFSGNRAQYGGGMFNHTSGPTVVNSSFSGNNGYTSGGGVYNENSSPTIYNSILWGDAWGEISKNDGGAAGTVLHSIVQGGWGTNPDENLNLDPQFVDANGADGQFGTADDNLRLQFSSSAIGIGSTALLPADSCDLDGDGNTSEKLPHDLDSNPRLFDTTLDLGAYENQAPNHAPVISGQVSLPDLRINPNPNPGSPIGSILTNPAVSDADSNPIGMAITGVDNTNGQWQYSLDGKLWTNLNVVSESNALLLEKTAYLRFMPDYAWEGVATLTFRAWDGTDGRSSGASGVVTGQNGGAKSFSAAAAPLSVRVGPIYTFLPMVANH